jgi:hypothetical protein
MQDKYYHDDARMLSMIVTISTHTRKPSNRILKFPSSGIAIARV